MHFVMEFDQSLCKWTHFQWFRLSFAQIFIKFSILLIFLQLSSSQKYICTWSIQKNLDVLKSYESESFISGAYGAWGQALPTSPEANVRWFSAKSRLTYQAMCTTPFMVTRYTIDVARLRPTRTVSVNQKLHYEKCSISKLRGPLPPRFVSEPGQVRTFLWYDYLFGISFYTFHFSVWCVEASGFENPKLHVQKLNS